MDANVHKFIDIFSGRQDAYGSDHGSAIWRAPTYDDYVRHLEGVEGMGIYPVLPTDQGPKVIWGCCDIDTGDWQEAYMLAVALSGMGLKPHIERSRSKGWHIWVFADDWVPAATMRRCLKVAYAAIDLPAKEANPKSENLRSDQLGNYVRLPYKSALLMRVERQTMMKGWSKNNDGSPLPLQDFLSMSFIDKFSDRNVIAKWATKWHEPERRKVMVSHEATADTVGLANRLPSTWRQTWLTGEVRDRSATFVAMAYDLAKRGWRPQDVFDILWGCPWNKYRDRNNGEVYVQDIVERAFS